MTHHIMEEEGKRLLEEIKSNLVNLQIYKDGGVEVLTKLSNINEELELSGLMDIKLNFSNNESFTITGIKVNRWKLMSGVIRGKLIIFNDLCSIDYYEHGTGEAFKGVI